MSEAPTQPAAPGPGPAPPTGTTGTPPVWRTWLPEGVLAAIVLVVGCWEAVSVSEATLPPTRGSLLLLATGVAAVVLLCRRQPGAALALTWAVGLLQLWFGVPPLIVEVALGAALFGGARWGRPVTLTLSGLSVPTVAAGTVLLAARIGYGDDFYSGIGRFAVLLDAANAFSATWRVAVAALALTLLAAFWLAGLALRFADRARASRASQVVAEQQVARAEREAEQAQEIARLREDQARLGRDVHDVVGHSLAVILAQAESGQFLPDDDPARLKTTLATIATSARGSLQDVRQVLAEPGAGPQAPRSLDTLVAGVRAGGHEVEVVEHGTPQPLPPDLEVTAFRVLQEMLTNAVRHGRREGPMVVERHWPDGAFAGELRIEVRNSSADAADGLALPADPGGRGLDGMRQRLAAVGGRLDVRPREGSFTATAWIPVSTR